MQPGARVTSGGGNLLILESAPDADGVVAGFLVDTECGCFPVESRRTTAEGVVLSVTRCEGVTEVAEGVWAPARVDSHESRGMHVLRGRPAGGYGRHFRDRLRPATRGGSVLERMAGANLLFYSVYVGLALGGLLWDRRRRNQA